MKNHRTIMAVAALIGLSMIGACNRNAEPESAPAAAVGETETVLDSGLTPKEQIETRQAQLKKMGKAFKTISDQLRSGSPDVAAIQEAAASVPVESAGMADWFPAGSGPETGLKTDALPAIWETPEDFAEKVADFRAASDALASAAASGDIAAIGPAFQATGGTCKSCHDTYRADD